MENGYFLLPLAASSMLAPAFWTCCPLRRISVSRRGFLMAGAAGRSKPKGSAARAADGQAWAFRAW